MVKYFNTPYPIQWLSGILSFFASIVIKKDIHKAVLTSFHGDGYRGNNKILFESLIYNSKIKPVWLTRNHSIYKDIVSKFGNSHVAYTHSFRGIKEMASAGLVFLSHGTSDYPFMYLPRRACCIQTYHGLPTKKGEYMRPDGNKTPGFFHRIILRYRFNRITHFLSSSPFVTHLYSKRFGLPQSIFKETGYPVYDKLIHSKNNKDYVLDKLSTDLKPEFIFLYAPTYRKFSKTKWFPFPSFDAEKLSSLLEKYNGVIVLRPHPNERASLEKLLNISPRFLEVSHKEIEDVCELLPAINGVITDYSSIYLEGLLLDIPCLFIPYDIKNYSRGIPYDYDTHTPGGKVLDQDSFHKEIENMIKHPGHYARERERVRNLFFSSTDGKATKKVIEMIEELVAKEDY